MTSKSGKKRASKVRPSNTMIHDIMMLSSPISKQFAYFALVIAPLRPIIRAWRWRMVELKGEWASPAGALPQRQVVG
jgi:hypothetical protein